MSSATAAAAERRRRRILERSSERWKVLGVERPPPLSESDDPCPVDESQEIAPTSKQPVEETARNRIVSSSLFRLVFLFLSGIISRLLMASFPHQNALGLFVLSSGLLYPVAGRRSISALEAIVMGSDLTVASSVLRKLVGVVCTSTQFLLSVASDLATFLFAFLLVHAALTSYS